MAYMVSHPRPRRSMVISCVSFLVLLPLCLQLAVSHASNIVKVLPGFQGPLPFELETGYVGVGESEDVQVFYYFVKSEGNPKEDPLMLWLTGGPGCSALSSLVFEIGPIYFEAVEYNGSLPTLVLNPHSWTKVSSIIFVDMPVGTGFSYATNPLASQTGDSIQVHQAYQFLSKWLMDHPEFLSNPVYIGGESYSGITVPAIVQMISNGNEEGIEPVINLKGYIIGNGASDQTVENNSRIPFAHGMELISDELYESLKRSCRGEYQVIDPSNTECLTHIQAFHKCTSGIYDAHILKPKCVFASPKPREIFSNGRSLIKNPQELLNFEPDLPTLGCPSYVALLSKYWANDKDVRKALHVREGSIGEWIRCHKTLPYTKDIKSSVKYHAELGTKGYRRLVYSGDHDFIVPFLGTEAWIRSLNYSIVDDWRPWHVQGQVAGYTRMYSNQMTFATVKGGGHTAPEYKPAECFAMFRRWIFEEPL